jgi:hypothetical protein
MQRHRLLYRPDASHNEQGMTLVLALVLLSVLTVVGTTAVTMTSTDLLVGGNYKASQLAFYNAEAGVQYTLASIATALSSGALALDGKKESEDYKVAVPVGFVSGEIEREIGTTGKKKYLWMARKEDNALVFEIDPVGTFRRVANARKYFFQVTGRPCLPSEATGRPCPASAISSVIEVVLQRKSLLPYGIFGDERVDLNTTEAVYSYNSRMTPDPTPEGSTGEADIGSNGVVSAYSSNSSLHIDGDVALGENSAGKEGKFEFRVPPNDSYSPPTTVLVGGKTITLLDVPRVNPDPLDADLKVGEKEKSFALFNNNGVAPNIINKKMDLPSGAKETFPDGDYYLESLTLNDKAELTINTSGGNVDIYVGSAGITLKKGAILKTVGDGRVNIYLDGKLEAMYPSRININGPPTSFRIYSRSKEPITFYHIDDFKGLVYAPFAYVTMHNASLKAYGLIWGKIVDKKNDWGATTFYFDTALKDEFLSNEISMISWKEVRN